MIYEIATIEVAPEREEAFEAGVRAARPLFDAADGCRSIGLQRSIEHPSRYRLIVGWDTVDHHMVEFRNSPAFDRWRELVGPHFASPPVVEHVSDVSLV